MRKHCSSPHCEELVRDGLGLLAIRQGIDNKPAFWRERLTGELKTAVLDDLYRHLWFFATKDGTHVDPLHVHAIKRRAVVVAEHPRLHLVWDSGIIYLKPIPDFLLSRTVWQKYLCANTSDELHNQEITYLREAALGFLRSYALLIRHESDFIIAKQANLIRETITFLKFQKFIKPFRHLSDADVAKRYHYGQLRLNYLNYAIRFLRPASMGRVLPWTYQNRFWQTTQYLQHFGAPLAFAFVIMSLILSAMQVVLAALGEHVWETFSRVSWGFSVAVIIFAACPISLGMLYILGVLLHQGQYSVRQKSRQKLVDP
ncbi:hypothetical protein B0T25DRAFT_342190 [Lasiosphaeria hispida]|uniref:Uncharacterized protein n=1 Tax=Lasiosphaeria hispida TaxID=260671 RepID=A0AAJ0M843_9PEZI|nr:hypothetical protein B0T25DRAFT_342190 [Lasiosphaeria hispida]